MEDVTLALWPCRRGGRPPRADVPATERIEITVTPEERAELGKMALQERRPVASIVRDAVNSYVADYSERRVFRSRRAARG